MSLLLSRLSRLRHEKPASVRSTLLFMLSNGFSTSLLQTSPCEIIGAGTGRLRISNLNEPRCILLEKKVPIELVYNRIFKYPMVTTGASHGWVATVSKKDGVMRLQEDLNPVASDTNPKRIPLPPLVTLPRCQTQIITNVSMSSSSPEDEDCVVAVKFLGPQISFCRPGQSYSEWINIRIENPSLFNSRVVFSKKHDMFRLLGSGGHLIGSFDHRKHMHKPKLQKLRFRNLPELKKTKRELLDSCFTSEHLVESQSTGETFLVKLYKNTVDVYKGIEGITNKIRTEAVTVFKLDEEGNAVYTQDIGDLSICISQSEPFTVTASSFPHILPNHVNIFDVDEMSNVDLTGDFPLINVIGQFDAPYFIPPQIINK